MTVLLLTVGLGVLLGVALQRGGFCGASLLSSAFLFKDGRGILGIGFAVAVSMAGFAVLVGLDRVVPHPNPMRFLSAVVGGLVFGVGMVLAGGCVSGTLFKAAEGRMTSILALIGVAMGAVATDEGALQPVKRALVEASRGVRTPTGLHDALGLSYPVTAGGLAALLVVILGVLHVRQSRRARRAILPPPRQLLTGTWPPALAGVAVGVLGWLAYLVSTAGGRNYPLGATGGVRGALSYVVRGDLGGNAWTAWLCGGLVLGAALSARHRRDWKLRLAEPDTLLFALLGGLLVGFGASVGRGCFIGNMVSGLALLSLHSLLFAACAVVGNWVATIVYLRGLK